MLLMQIREAGLPEPVLEHRFAPPRRWRFDLFFYVEAVAVEVEGGVWTGGRHTRPSGFLKDIEKYNEATRLGFSVYRVTPSMIKSGEAIALLRKVLG